MHKHKKLQRAAVSLLIAAMAVSFTGCSNNTVKTNEDENVKITIGGWPVPESQPEKNKLYGQYLEEYKSLYPNVEVATEEYSYSLDQFLSRYVSGQQPDVYYTPFTEPKRLAGTGYVRDVTDEMKARGFDKAISPQILDVVTVDGKYYGLPTDAYVMGLMCNVDLFKQAGLVDENGVPIYPTTYEELAETAKTIKEKTGISGFTIPTTGTEGGWMFMNIAWSYGVKFIEKTDDGKYKAAFETQEMYDALQYISDLKWKYNVFPDSVLNGTAGVEKMFGVKQTAMIINSDVNVNGLVEKYTFDKDILSFTGLPAGPKDRCTLIGGGCQLMGANLTDAQVKACFDWEELIGNSSNFSQEELDRTEENLKALQEEGKVITRPMISIWTNKERVDAINKIYDKYVNVDERLWTFNQNDVTLRIEEPVAAQQLYSVLSNAMQEVILNKDADIKATVATAAKTLQVDYLDKME